MVNVQCIKCGKDGSLVQKQTKSKGRTYVYWYLEHHIGDKIKWCYLGKYEKLPEAYWKLIHKDTQTDTQTTSSTTHNVNILNSRSIQHIASNQIVVREGPWSRLDRTLACEAGDPGFKSPRARHP